MTIFLPILGFIFFFILVILVVGLTVLSKVIKTILGFGQKLTGRSSGYSSSRQKGSSRGTSYSADGADRGTVKKNKVFDSDEGEYVDFEEIKEG